MSLLMDISNLVGSSSRLNAFIEEGILSKAIQEIGHSELRAASDAFSERDAYANDEQCVSATLEHLRSAHHLFSELSKERERALEKGRHKTISKNSPISTSIRGSHHDFWTCCLIAICHAYLGNSTEAVTKWMKNANYAAYLFFESSNKHFRIPNNNGLDQLVCYPSFFGEVFYIKKTEPFGQMLKKAFNAITGTPFYFADAMTSEHKTSHLMILEPEVFRILCRNLDADYDSTPTYSYL